MAISAGSTLLWSDMSSLFTRVSNIRKKYGYSAISPGSYGGQGQYATVANVSNMAALLREVRGHGYATAIVDKFSIPIPGFGTIIYASTMTPIINLIGALEGACIFDNFGFFSCNGFQNFAFFSCNGFNSFNGFVTFCNYFNTSFSYRSSRGTSTCGPYNLSVTWN